MRTQIIRKFYKNHEFAIILFVGIVIGTFYVNISGRLHLNLPDIFSSDYFENFSNTKINHLTLWYYILKYRLRDFFILTVLYMTFLRKQAVYLYMAFTGMCAGALISISVLNHGICGVMIYLTSVFPQYIFYAVILFIFYFLVNSTYIQKRNKIIFFCVIFLLIMIGTYCESYICPEMLKGLYNFLYE